MENSNNLNQIFSESGCPDEETLELYATGKLTTEETREVEHHLTTCGFCSDTVESIRLMGVPAFRAAVERVNQTIAEKVSESGKKIEGKQDTKVIPMRTRRFRWMGIAASVAILAVATVMFTGGGQGDMENLDKYYADAREVAYEDNDRGNESPIQDLIEKREYIKAARLSEDPSEKGILYMKADNADSAIFYLKDQQEDASANAVWINWFYGVAQGEKGNYKEALVALEKAVNTKGFPKGELGKNLIAAIKAKMKETSGK